MIKLVALFIVLILIPLSLHDGVLDRVANDPPLVKGRKAKLSKESELAPIEKELRRHSGSIARCFVEDSQANLSKVKFVLLWDGNRHLQRVDLPELQSPNLNQCLEDVLSVIRLEPSEGLKPLRYTGTWVFG